MKCIACGQEIALAKKCPYCGETQRESAGRQRSSGSAAESEFKGRMHGDDRHGRQARAARPVTWRRVWRFLIDERIPLRRKWVLYAAVFYVLSPFDLIPIVFFGPLGWVDDLVVVMLAWQWLQRNLP